MHDTPSSTRKVRVWDLPLRLFHWLLLAAVVTAFVAIKTGNIDLHARAGYCVLALLVFRLIWGFVGGTHARFFNFIKGPKAVFGYLAGLRGAHDPAKVGHNPLGALSVLALLGVLLTQALTGIFNYSDSYFFEAPLYKFISSDTYGLVASIHGLLEWVIIALVVLHLAAILFYRFARRDNLITPMITGSKLIPAEAATPDATGGHPLLGLLALAVGLGVIWVITTL